MDYYQRIADIFQQTIEVIAMSVDNLALPIEQASQLMTDALLQDCKIVACGNGADSAISQLFVSNLLSCVEHDRPALPAMSLGLDGASLTGIATSNSLEDVFARQIHALGKEGDILLCVSSASAQPNLINAVQAAHDRNMSVVSLSDSSDKHLRAALTDADIELAITADRQPRIIELHAMAIQCLCELIELRLFGDLGRE